MFAEEWFATVGSCGRRSLEVEIISRRSIVSTMVNAGYSRCSRQEENLQKLYLSIGVDFVCGYEGRSLLTVIHLGTPRKLMFMGFAIVKVC